MKSAMFEILRTEVLKNCQSCGNCCKGLFVKLSEAEIEEIVKRGFDRNDFINYSTVVAMKGDDRRCYFLDETLEGFYSCSIYDIRPKECSDFPSFHEQLVKCKK